MIDRALTPEAMDDPSLGRARHRNALRGLARLNWLSGSVRVVWPSILTLARRERRPLGLLDLGSGAGDVPLGLWRRARRARIELDIRGLDVSPNAVGFARERAARAGAPVTFEVRDAEAAPLPRGYDVVVCSLFLHHLSEERALSLLVRMREAAGRMVLVSDLRRCRRGLALAWIASRLFTGSDVVHADAPRSVRAAFDLSEARSLVHRAGMDDAEILRRWPFRYLLRWSAV
jgi:SAM-dependent methyltransferase